MVVNPLIHLGFFLILASAAATVGIGVKKLGGIRRFYKVEED